MKNHILGLMMLIGTAFSITAQEYVEFPTEDSMWRESTRFIGLGFEAWTPGSSEIIGDTIINDTTYQQVYFHREEGWFSAETIYAGGLRENNNQQIYFRPSLNCTSDEDDYLIEFGTFPNAEQEYLLYDFSSMDIGAELFYPNESLNEGESSYVILDIDSININGTYRKRYVLDDNTSYMYDESYFIEGVGSSLGLLAPFKPNDLYYDYSQLACFEENENTWQNDLHLEVVDCQLGVSIDEIASPQFRIYPNPTNDKLHIEIPISKGEIELELYSTEGKVVLSQRTGNLSRHTLGLNKFSEGIYILKIISDQKINSTYRVVIN